MPNPVYSRNDTDIILAQQSVWGTAIADNAAGVLLDVESAVFDPDFNDRRPNRSNSGSRVLQDVNIQVDSKGSTPKATLKGDAKLADIAHFIHAVMQNVVETATPSPYSKVFTFPATQPDFTAIASLASAGWIATLIEKHPAASTSSKIVDAICTDLTLTCAPDAGNGRLQFAAAMMGRGTMSMVANPSGTYTRVAQTFFNFHDLLAVTVGGSYLTPLSIEIKISQPKTKAISTNSSSPGMPLTYAIPEYAVTAKLKVLKDSVAETVRANWGTSTSSAYVIRWGTAAATGYLNFALQGALLKAPNVIEDVNAIEFELAGVKSGSTQSLTVTLCDAVLRGWKTS
jgi:hypothetical protein